MKPIVRKMFLSAAMTAVLLGGVLASASAAPLASQPNSGPAGGSKALENPRAAEPSGDASRLPKNAPAGSKESASASGRDADPSPGGTGEPGEKPKLSFPVISDIHIQSWHTESHMKFTQALQDLNAVNPASDALVINGDLTNGMPADYAKLQELIGQQPHPRSVFYTIGNHEFYKAWFDADGYWNPATFPNGETEEASIARFLDLTGQKNKVYYDQMVKGYHFIFLGSEQYRQSDPANLEDAYLSSEQLDWLKKTLRKGASSDKPIFVFLHQPLPYTVAGTHFCCVNNRAVVQHEELKAILSEYPQVVFFSGHSHWELKLPGTLVQEKFTMVNTSSVVQPWTDNGSGGEMLTAPEESEGLYVEVYKDRVTIKGRDFYRHRWIPEADFTIPVKR
ncbi:metallophosphoesterase family protein [Paenibacillus mucilaginosus]|uniref:metallophosphoesterase family protein n=1 Tax=Paenibacillus mucilaginosus TaxID=61624 RepID=UPI001F3644BB|nr:metallophosphoesterase [Paenibacillus mucilaginosus]MCG7216968.1 metallophosphoesterase [Paenibacillus mucilaginosus]